MEVLGMKRQQVRWDHRRLGREADQLGLEETPAFRIWEDKTGKTKMCLSSSLGQNLAENPCDCCDIRVPVTVMSQHRQHHFAHLKPCLSACTHLLSTPAGSQTLQKCPDIESLARGHPSFIPPLLPKHLYEHPHARCYVGCGTPL